MTTKSLERPEVGTFVNFYLENAPQLVPQVGYIPLSAPLYAAIKTRFSSKVGGTVYAAPDAKGKTLDQLYLPTT